MNVTIWEKATGKAIKVDTVDAREILVRSPELYTNIDPDPEATAAQPVSPPFVSDVEDEYRREPVGDNPPEAPREQTVLRNPTGATWPGLK